MPFAGAAVSELRRLHPARRVYSLVLVLALSSGASSAFGDATYQTLLFSQSWTNTGLLFSDDNWTLVPGVQGYRGDGLTASPGDNPQVVLGNDSPGVIDVNVNQTSPETFATGGVTEFHVADPVVALTGSSTADAPYLVFYVNAASRFNIVVSYRLRDIDGSGDNSVQQVALQFRTSAAGTWTNVPAGYVADATDGPSLLKETSVSATLPANANGAATLQVRVITSNAIGTDEWVGVDNVSITGTPEPFADVTTPVLGDAGAAAGVVWGDFDADGDRDLYHTKFGGASNKLFRNDAGTWVDATSGPLGAASDGRGVTTADFDNDGDLDLYVANYFGASNKLYRNDAGTWVDATSGAAGGVSNTQNVGFADFDGDGDVDLYLANQGANKLIRNDAGTWVDATTGPLGDASTSQGFSAADFDNDGDLDIFLANQGASNKLFRNDTGTWSDVTAAPLNFSGGSNGVAAGDDDNDGDLDLYVCTINGQSNKLYRNDLGSWTDITSGPLGETTACSGVTAADFDNDGDLDLYVCRTAGANKLFRNDAGTWVEAPGVVAANPDQSQGVAAGDYDGDGDLDLYLVNNGSANKLYRNENANGNHWLHVKLVGTISNRSAIGARVRVVAGGITRIRDVEGITGRYAQNSLAVEFGLGASTTIDSLVVRWPSGFVQAVTPPAVDQLVTVTETPPLFVDTTSDPLGLSASWSGVAWGDYDNDDDLDLYVSSLNSANKLFRNDGGSWSDATTAPLDDGGRGAGVAWADVDHDGDLDL